MNPFEYYAITGDDSMLRLASDPVFWLVTGVATAVYLLLRAAWYLVFEKNKKAE